MLKKGLMRKKMGLWSLGLLLCLMLAVFLTSATVWGQSYGDLETEQPVLVMTGQGIIADGIYSAANVSYERSYTLAELQTLGDIKAERLYSAINSSGARRIYRGEGVDLSGLLELSGYSGGGMVFAVSPGSSGLTVTLNLNDARYCYPGVASGDTAGSAPVSALLAWKNAYAIAPDIPAPGAMTAVDLTLMVGQTSVTDVNNSLYNRGVNQVRVGAAITDTPITVLSADYTRAEVLLLPRAENTYTYSSSGGERNDTVRGVPLAVLLAELSDDAVLEFHAADDYPVSMSGLSKAELAAKNAILAYETFENSAWQGIYSTAKSGPEFGFFTLYAEGFQPAKMIDSIGEKVAVASPYKHITYSGPPYNIDAITSATLTVEGPGVYGSVPISLRELEESAGGHIRRGVYSDIRGSGSVNFSYEGVKLLSVLDGLINAQVECLDDNVMVVFKNRWRQEIGRAAYADIKAADDTAPVILAYGTASADGSTLGPAPFVFNLAAGIIGPPLHPGVLGNDDGPLKLVYDQSRLSALAAANPKFTSVAYLYIEEGTPPPGFKHIAATDPAYSNKVNTEYLLTFTGSALGREINFTVEELENMVEYENGAPKSGGLGHRDEYSLSNTTYWYVNEYEGLKVWDLLTKIGLDAGKYQNDDATLVSFSAWDNYQITAQFSMKQLADPELFYFYEKSPLDIGTDRPTKEQLATAAYQPDNQIGTWTKDANNYPVKRGYPVMLAYGVNGYPYVRDSNLPGYKSGLGNSGGPLRVIYGKADGLNRDNPVAIENYAYFFNNGSQQLQRVQEVYVGEPLRYSTHLQNPATAYQTMKDQQALTVEVIGGGSSQTYTFTLAELENILYGPDVSKRDRDSENRQEKGYYITRIAGTNPINELYEGVNLQYLLTEYIGLPGSLGTVEMYSGSDASPEGIYNLADIGAKGYNSARGTVGLGMMVAFAKNGFPLVDGPNNATDNTNPGYVHNDPLDSSKGIRNGVGPLHFIRAQTATENAVGAVNSTVGEAKTLVENLTRIVVNLEPDIFAHVGLLYETYAAQNVLFSGAVAQQGGKTITVGSLETKQKYMVTGSYTVDGVAYTYRGLNLAALLSDKDIGASALTDAVTVKNGLGESITLTLAELSGKNAILAYGIAKAGDTSDGKPLVFDSASSGYEAAYLNSGGPLRLIFTDGAAADFISNVTEIEVGAVTLDGWKHTSGNFLQYASFELAVSGQNLAHNKTFTVAELEAMDNIIVSDAYQMGGPTWIQGVDLYKLLQNIGFAKDLESSVFTANSVDNYPISFNATDLKNGVNGKPILIAFGQGTSSANGLPLVPEITSPGFDPNVGNSYGPLRLVVHDNTGWCVKYLNSIVVGAAGGTEDPIDFSFSLCPGGIGGMPVAQVTAVVSDKAGGIWAGTAGAGAAYIAPSGQITHYSTTSTPALKSDTVTAIAIDKTGVAWFSQGGSSADQSTHQGFACFENGVFTFINRDNSDLPNNRVNGLDVDNQGNVWLATTYNSGSAGTFLGGTAKYDSSADAWQSWTQADGLPTASTWSVKADNRGGAWVTTYRSGAYDDNPPDISYVYINPAGNVNAYDMPKETTTTHWSYSADIDSNGGVYIVRFSGTSDNVKGRLDYIAPGSGVVSKSYSATELLPAADLQDILDANAYGLVKVFVDAADNLWLSTDFSGVYRFTTANGLVDTASMVHYSSATGCWPAGPFDSVWSIHISPDGQAVFGSNGGVAWTIVELKPPDLDYVGDATPTTAQLTISGAVEKPGYFTLAGLQAYTELVQTKNYTWLNNAGNTGTTAATGIYLEDLLKNVMTLDPRTVSITLTASDNSVYTVQLNDQLLGASWLDGAGNKLMLAWLLDGNPPSRLPLQLMVGQTGPDHVNRALWLGGVIAITVNAGATQQETSVLDPPFTIKQGGKSDITWVIGGSGNSIKNLPNNAGKEEKMYKVNGQNINVRGAALSSILTASGIDGDNVLLTISTTDNSFKQQDIKLADISANEYFLAYDIFNAVNGEWDKIADVDKANIQASLRIYRKISASTGEEIKYISGLTISIVNTVNPDIIPNSDHIGDATSTTAQLSIAGAVEKPGYFTINGLKTWPGLTRRTRTYSSLNSAGTKASRTMTGIYLEDLLTNVLKLKSNAKSITVTASDGYYFEFNLDSNVSKMDAYTNYAGNFQAEVPGVYYTDKDGNKLMLAWEENGSALSSLRLVVGQINPDHINNPMWVNNINSITVNTQAVGKLDTPITTSSLETAASLILKATITTTNNVVTASNTAKEVSQALASINAVSASQETKSKTLIIDATTEEETTKTKYSLPSEALQALSANEQTELELLTDQGSLFFSAELLKYLNSDNKETLVIEIETIDPLENDYLAATAITINLGNKVIHSLNNMLLKANTPFIPEASLKKEGIVLYRLDNNEEKTLIKLSAYDQKSNSMRHGLWHLSTYVIGYSPVTFPDIHGHWGKSYIEFLAARHIVNGRTEDIFDPDGKITRAEFVKMLAETVDFLDMSSSVPAGFSDVPKSAWYAGYINWAAALGIVQGNTDGTFRPNNMINREQMAAMTERFIRSLKFNIKATEKAIDFTDQQQISSYAINAIRAMQQYAILAGNPDGSFKPQSPTSRSEAAKVITTLIEAILK